MELKDAFKKITSDKELAKRFTETPEEVLQELAVDMTGLKIETVPKEDDELAGGPFSDIIGVDVCGSIGCVGCVSVGG